MRILHLADVHLDTSFAGRTPRVRARLRQATRDAFRHAVELALERRVDVVVVAGDLFDGERLSFESERFLLFQLQRLSDEGIPVIYATGNHDPGSRRSRELIWPPDVIVVDDPSPRRIAVRNPTGEPVGWVTAAGHASAHETQDLAAAFPRPEGELPEVAVLHTQVVDSRDAAAHEPYAPTALETLTRSGYDYWALGHVHLRQTLSRLPGVRYPGNLQGRTPRESGAKGALLVEVSRGLEPRVEFVPLAPIRWVDLELACDAETLDQLVRHIRDRWGGFLEGEEKRDVEWIVRVRLRGPSPLWREMESEEERAYLAGELEEVLGVLEVRLSTEAVHPPVDSREHRDREDVLGTALRLLELVREGRIELTGLPDELRAAPDPDALPGYLASILQGAGGDLASRLLAPED
ncbi:MAG: DNA repair exonuclease [Gemmatimonadota bacterium]|jgi:exonuclease SbcD